MAKRMSVTEWGIGPRLEEKARTQMNHADIVRRMLLGRGVIAVPDGDEIAESGGNVSAINA